MDYPVRKLVGFPHQEGIVSQPSSLEPIGEDANGQSAILDNYQSDDADITDDDYQRGNRVVENRRVCRK
jgi:hypothetical protein